MSILASRWFNSCGAVQFSMPMEIEYEYMWATIDTANRRLSIYHDSELVEEYPYTLPKTFIDVSKINLLSL